MISERNLAGGTSRHVGVLLVVVVYIANDLLNSMGAVSWLLLSRCSKSVLINFLFSFLAETNRLIYK